MIMSANVTGDPEAFGNAQSWQNGYFNEYMSCFEHQVASHLIAEGMVTKGLALTHAIHQRYHAAKRNPFNGVGCSDHYARAVAGYGSFITMCGFIYHDPSGHLGLTPRLMGDFQAAFTTAEGWGTMTPRGKTVTLTVRSGTVTLHSLTVHGQTKTFETPLVVASGGV